MGRLPQNRKKTQMGDILNQATELTITDTYARYWLFH